MATELTEIVFDKLGPSKIIHIYSPKTGFKAIVVIDNIALGPSIGGVRVSPTINTLEVARLARTMTMKNSIAGLPHGGGKAGIIANHRDPKKNCISESLPNKLKIYMNIFPGLIWAVMRRLWDGFTMRLNALLGFLNAWVACH